MTPVPLLHIHPKAEHPSTPGCQSPAPGFAPNSRKCHDRGSPERNRAPPACTHPGRVLCLPLYLPVPRGSRGSLQVTLTWPLSCFLPRGKARAAGGERRRDSPDTLGSGVAARAVRASLFLIPPPHPGPPALSALLGALLHPQLLPAPCPNPQPLHRLSPLMPPGSPGLALPPTPLPPSVPRLPRSAPSAPAGPRGPGP